MKYLIWKTRNILWYSVILMSLTFGFSRVFAYNPVDQHISDTLSQQCQENKNLAHYIGQSISYGILVKDGESSDRYLNNHPTTAGVPIADTPENMPYISKIYLWNPYGVLSSSPTATEANQLIPNFMYISNVKPEGVSKVKFARQFAAMYTTTGWMTRTWVSAQINAQISKQQIGSKTAQTTSSYKWFDENNGVHLWNYKINSAFNPSPKNTICMNFYVATCWDKVIDDPNKEWWNSTNGKQGIQTAQWFVVWTNTGFTAEKCDSNTETGAACVNGTLGCCNATCSWFGWSKEKCGDETLQPAGTYYNGDTNDMSFEECDDGDTENDTDWMINGDDPSFHFCSSICLPTFTEAFVEVFIN